MDPAIVSITAEQWVELMDKLQDLHSVLFAVLIALGFAIGSLITLILKRR